MAARTIPPARKLCLDASPSGVNCHLARAEVGTRSALLTGKTPVAPFRRRLRANDLDTFAIVTYDPRDEAVEIGAALLPHMLQDNYSFHDFLPTMSDILITLPFERGPQTGCGPTECLLHVEIFLLPG